MRYDVRQISEMLASRVEDVCAWLLPGGRKNGSEYRAASVSGGAGDSLGVNLNGKAGVWKDFAGSEKGGDLIDLIMASQNMGKAEAVKAAKEFLCLKDDAPEFMSVRKAYKLPAKPAMLTAPKSAVVEYMAGRGISQKTMQAYKVGEIDNAEKGPTLVFPYLHGDVLKFIKYRPIRDKKAMWTSAESEPCLFGWHVVEPDARYIIVTEGELDAMTFYEQGYPALSIPRGAGTGAQQDEWIANEWDRLQAYDAIYLAFDNDDAGKKAREQVLTRLGRHRCYVLDFGKHKDANDLHQAGERLADVITGAKSCDPPELRSATEFVDDVLAIFEGRDNSVGITLPWSRTERNVRLRLGEISVWAGFNGSGKSQIVGHVMVDSIRKGERWCAASMELKPARLLHRMYRQAAGTNMPTNDRCRGPLASLFDRRLYLFDVQGTAKAEKLLEVFDYAMRRYGCRHFLVDSLAKCGFGEDDYNGQKHFVDRLMEFAMHNGVHVHIVAHSRKKAEESSMPDKMDVKGTGALTDMVDNVFVIWRNKPKEETKQNSMTGDAGKYRGKPDCVLNCCKQRHGEWEGKVGLFFDKASLQYVENEGDKAMEYDMTTRSGNNDSQ